MNIDEQVLKNEREGLDKEFNCLKEKITNLEVDLAGMRSQLNALHGARQQVDKLLKLAEMPKEEEKK